jgi:hypothetical protein
MSKEILLGVLFITTLALGYVIHHLNSCKNSKFVFEDLFLKEDKADPEKLILLGAFVASTWALIYLTAQDKLTEWFYTAYIGSFVAARGINKFLDNKNDTRN